MGTAAGNDAGAFDCVALAWRSHEAELRAYLRHRSFDAQVADDVLQEVFLKAVRHGRNFRVLENPRAWLFQVARNELADRARRTRPTEALPEELAAPEPEGLAPVDELAGCLSRCLGELSQEDADVLRHCDLEGQTARAYAKERNLSIAAAKSRLLRARRRLKAQLTTACQVRLDASGAVQGHVPRDGPHEADPTASPSGTAASTA
jgi:RNA polymerase sigma-70 factor (ECF subfamily)